MCLFENLNNIYNIPLIYPSINPRSRSHGPRFGKTGHPDAGAWGFSSFFWLLSAKMGTKIVSVATFSIRPKGVNMS